MYLKDTQYGFEWGAVKIERGFSDEKEGWVALSLITPKYPYMQIYVTKTGKVRIYDSHGEWKPPVKKKKKKEEENKNARS